MKKILVLSLFLLLLVVSSYATGNPRTYYQKVVAQNGIDIRTLVTNSGNTSYSNYRIQADILETTGEGLDTNTDSYNNIRLTKLGDAPDDYVAVFVQLSTFTTPWAEGQTLRITVTKTDEFPEQTTQWDYVIPAGTTTINILEPAQEVPPLGTSVNPKPYMANSPNPPNFATGVPISSSSLSWTYTSSPDYTDPTGYKVYYGTSYPPTSFSLVDGMSNTILYIPTLGYHETCYWQVIPYNTSGDAVDCPVWEFITEDSPPIGFPPSATTPTSPMDLQSDVGLSTSLNWDISLMATGYKLNYGTDYPPTNLHYAYDLGSTTSYNTMQPIAVGMTYYWQIVPYNSYGDATDCPIWSFSTPGATPENHATGVSINTTLNWQVGEPTYLMSYYLYVGTDNPPTNIVNDAYLNGSSLSYDYLPTLSYNTKYYWQLIPNQSVESAQFCPIWDFTTMPDPATIASDLFISEYIEGTSNNRAIEIFNGTGASVDLSQYSFRLASNGGAWSPDITTHRILPNNDVFIIADAGATAAILAQADTISVITYFNGNDAIGLFKNGLLIDAIGVQGIDPGAGSGWTVAGTPDATLNHTLIRKASISRPTTNWTVSAGTTANNSQWVVYPIDYISNLGSHTFTPGVLNPFIDVTGSLTSFTSTIGAPSSPQSYHVTGIDLSTSIEVMAPHGYEICTTADGTYSTLLSLDSAYDGLVYVRLSGVMADSCYGYITHNSTGASQASLYVTGFVISSPPSAVSYVSPLNNALDVSLTTTFNWNASDTQNGYKFYLGTDYPPSNLINGFDNGNYTSYTLTSPLNNSQVYYWKVVPYNSLGDAIDNSTWQFTTLSGSSTVASDLFFSEYIEGSSNNKAVEIFNGTGAPVNLSQYTIKLAANGGAWSTSLISTRTLAHNETFVIANVTANATILAQADTTSTITYFNGNDAVGLFKNGFLIDTIGLQGTDPGVAGWDVAGTIGAMLNHTIVRKPTVISPTTDWAASAGTNADNSQWIVYPIDTFTDLGTHTFTPGPIPQQVAAPEFSPMPGTYNEPQSVTIYSATTDAYIRYTIDGTTPTETNGILYTGVIPVDGNQTINAIAYKTDWNSSAVTTATYNFVVSSPQFMPPPGIYTNAQTVSMSFTTSGAEIHYTIDGTDPNSDSPLYVIPIYIPLNTNMIIKAIATKLGWSNSDIASAGYIITGQVAFNTPVFSPPEGSYSTEQYVAINSPIPSDATVMYTTDGSDPSPSNGNLYSVPIFVSSNQTIKAIAYKADWTSSTIEQATYTFFVPIQPPSYLQCADDFTAIGYVNISWNAPYSSVPDAYRLYRQFGTQTPEMIMEMDSLHYRDRVHEPASYWVKALYGTTESVPTETVLFTPQSCDYNETAGYATNVEIPALSRHANMFPGYDVDYYMFYVGSELSSYMLEIKTECAEYIPIDLQASLYGPYPMVQTEVNSADLIATDDNSAGDLQPLIRTSVLGRSGYYYLKIDRPARQIKRESRTGLPNDFGDYNLQIQLLDIPVAIVSIDSIDYTAEAANSPTSIVGSFVITNTGADSLAIHVESSNTTFLTCNLGIYYLGTADIKVGAGSSTNCCYYFNTYNTPGVYNGVITLTTNDSFNPIRTIPVTLHLNRQSFKAEFTASQTTGGAPLTVSFTDQSYVDEPGANINSWDWTFGDGNTSKLQNPVHVYQGIGTYDVGLTVRYSSVSGTDTLSYQTTTTKNEYIHATNTPPVISHQIADLTINEDTPYILNLAGAFTDPNGQVLTYNFSVSDNYDIQGHDSLYTITPAPNWNGTDSIRVTADDGVRSTVSQSFLLHVLPVNDPPIIITSPPTNITFAEDTEDYSLHLYEIFNDPDGDPLSFSISGAENILVDIEEGSVTLHPEANWWGTENIRFIARDNYGTSSYATFVVEVTVTNVNDVLTLSLPSTIYFNKNASYSFNVRPYISGTDWSTQRVSVLPTVNLISSVEGTIVNLSTTSDSDFVENLQVAVEDTLYREIVIQDVAVHVIAQGTGISNTDIVSGDWETTGSPFYIMGGLDISSTDSLTIQSGVVVNFLADSTFVVNGNLSADSVSFGTLEGGSWGGLVFGTGSDESQLNDCFIFNALQPILIEGSDIEVDSCTIEIDSTLTTPTGAAILVTGGGSPHLTNLIINNYNQGIVIENLGTRATTTPSLSNLRIRNSSNSGRTDAIGVLLNGDIDAKLDSLVIENYDYGIKYQRGNQAGGRTTPSLSNLRIRNSSNSNRTNNTGIYLENMANVIIENDSIGNCLKGIEIVNQARGTATPSMSNLRIRNSSNSNRTDNYGIVLTGNIIAQITNSVIEEVMFGIYYSGSAPIQRTTPSLSNLRIRNSSNSRSTGKTGIYLSGLPEVIVDNDSITGFNNGVVIEETNRAATSTPTLSNLRIRNSSNSNRTDTIGMLFQGSVDAKVNLCDIDGYVIGIRYLRQLDRAGTGTQSLSNLRIRNSSNSRLVGTFGMYLDNMDKVFIVNDSIDGYAVGIQFANTSRAATAAPTLSNLRIRNSSNSNRNTGIGLILLDSRQGLVKNCWFENYGTGIKIPDSNRMRITGNTIKNCTMGIEIIGSAALPIVDHNQLYLNSSFYSSNPGTANWAISINAADSLTIRNNTINQYSHALKLVGSELRFVQNICWNDVPNPQPVEKTGSRLAADYNDISFSGGLYEGIGNINTNPLFRNPLADDFNLTLDSPCIDAGGLHEKKDEDGTLADQGAIPYLHKAGFIADKRFETIGEVIQFTSVCLGHDPALSAYAWDFDNNGSWDSYEMNPSHTFAVQGFYTIKLRVQTSTLVDSIVQVNYIVIQNAALSAPQNMHVIRQNNSLELSWSPVTHDLQGNDVTVNFYLIYHANDPNVPFEFLASTEGLTHYTHLNALDQDAQQYYFVIGFVGTRIQMQQFVNSHRRKSWQKEEQSLTKPLERK